MTSNSEAVRAALPGTPQVHQPLIMCRRHRGWGVPGTGVATPGSGDVVGGCLVR